MRRAYLRLLYKLHPRHGVRAPDQHLHDQHGALQRNDDHWTLAEELRGRQDPTQVGVAMQALGITAIYALSPQAKGRVERLWGTLQDRLVSELRLAGATTATEANASWRGYRPDHNRRFAITPADTASAWRPVHRALDLRRVCSFRYEATVLKDHTVRLGGLVLDIPPGPAATQLRRSPRRGPPAPRRDVARVSRRRTHRDRGRNHPPRTPRPQAAQHDAGPPSPHRPTPSGRRRHREAWTNTLRRRTFSLAA